MSAQVVGVKVFLRDGTHRYYGGATHWLETANRMLLIMRSVPKAERAYKAQLAKPRTWWLSAFSLLGGTEAEIIATININEMQRVEFYTEEDRRRP